MVSRILKRFSELIQHTLTHFRQQKKTVKKPSRTKKAESVKKEERYISQRTRNMQSNTQTPLTEFKRFPDFPKELRRMIWTFAIDGQTSRNVSFEEYLAMSAETREWSCMTKPISLQTALPATFHATSESRQVSMEHYCMFWFSAYSGPRYAFSPIAQAKMVAFNPDIDTLTIPIWVFCVIKKIYNSGLGYQFRVSEIKQALELSASLENSDTGSLVGFDKFDLWSPGCSSVLSRVRHLRVDEQGSGSLDYLPKFFWQERGLEHWFTNLDTLTLRTRCPRDKILEIIDRISNDFLEEKETHGTTKIPEIWYM